MVEEKENNLSNDSVPGGANVTPAKGEENDSDPVRKVLDSTEDVGIAEVLSTVLGREFTSDEEALKSVKETYGYVGKVGKILPLVEQLQTKGMRETQIIGVLESLMKDETPAKPEPQNQPAMDPSKFVSRDEFEETNFYSGKPEFAPYKGIIRALKNQNLEKSLSEVVELEEFKGIYTKAHSFEEQEKSKSVLETNPRLGQVGDKISQAREAQKTGDQQTAETAAVGAVLDAFEN